jgi:2-keto-4-pentenoate hydratase/2-oxohepta-3-ene-1,7-dioic acid hydratase in catechol pathway
MSLEGTNSYILRAPGSAGAVVVDPGPLDEVHLQALAGAGTVELVLITHRHADHTAGAVRLHQLTGAPVRAADPAHCHGSGNLLQDGEVLSAAGLEIRVLATPGHTSDSVCFHVPGDGPQGSLLSGDTILGRGTTMLDYPDGTLADYLTSLDKLEALGPATVLPAHGPALPSLAGITQAYRSHRLQRLAQIRAALDRLGGDAAVGDITDAVRCGTATPPARCTRAAVAAPARRPAGAGRDGRVEAMRIARFVVDSDPLYGVVEGDSGSEVVTVIHGDPFFNGVERTSVRHKLEDVRLLAPIIPRSKVVGVGRNFVEHAHELGNDVPAQPLLFLKPNTAVVGPNDPVVLPEFSEEVSFEAELCVVIGRICKDVPEERVDDVIFGYTCGNDLTARDVQKSDLQWTRAKGFDTSAPLGPWIETDLDPEDVQIQARLNGELRQDGSTSQMIRGVRELVSVVSQAFTLLPGDVIMTGTPAGVGLVSAGDRIEVEIEGIGRLSNPIVRR